MADDDFFAELDAEIAKAQEKVAIRKNAAAAKKKAMSRAVAEVERITALREWKELQAIIDADIWRPVSLVAFFTEQECDGCGSVHSIFLQYMEEQLLRSKPQTRRWVRTQIPEPGLPRTVLTQKHKTHVCADCAIDHGFDLDAASVFNMPNALSISSTYDQGDINAAPEESGSASPDGVTAS